jgi:hypothetical protein
MMNQHWFIIGTSQVDPGDITFALLYQLMQWLCAAARRRTCKIRMLQSLHRSGAGLANAGGGLSPVSNVV